MHNCRLSYRVSRSSAAAFSALVLLTACSADDAADPNDGELAQDASSASPDSHTPDSHAPDSHTPDTQGAEPTPLPAPAELPEQVAPPDVLTHWASGAAVTTADQWTGERAPEIVRLMDHYAYGRAPTERAAVSWTASAPQALTELPGVVLEELTVELLAESGSVTAHVALFRPAGDGPWPVWLALNPCGNHTLTTDPAVRISDGYAESNCRDGSPTSPRGWREARWPIADIVARGYALAAVHQSDFGPDDPTQPTVGLRGAFTPDPPETTHWGLLRAWAWGLSHVVDVLIEQPTLDPARIATVGHSRRGKAALLTAAADARVALTVPHQAGTLGTTLSRSSLGESVDAITLVFPHWFSSLLPQFANRETYLPFDQHAVIALVAPRPVLVTCGAEDTWADPPGALAAVTAASPVWTLLGSTGFLEAGRLDTPLAWHERPGGHDLLPEDWTTFMDFADQHLPTR